MAVDFSFPAAVDWLVTNITALPECAAPVVVADGWPPERADKAVVVGLTPEDPETGNETAYAELGAQMEWENVSIPCIAWAYVGGGEEAMKTARDAVYTIMDAIGALLRTTAGRTLGGAVHSGAAAIRNVRTVQTGDVEPAGAGRSCEVRFNIAYNNRF